MRAFRRRRWQALWLLVAAGSVVAAMLAVPATTSTHKSSETKLTKVSFREDFFDSDAHAGIYAGVDMKFWEKEGLDVSVKPGQGSISTIQQVAQGNDTFGYANAFTMAQQVVKGADVVAIGSTRQTFDGGVVYWPDTGISKPSDLVGKNYIGAAAGFIDVLLPLFAKNSGGWDSGQMQYQNLDPSAGQALFAAHKADAITGTATQILLTPPVNGVAAKIFRYSDYGINPLSFVIVVNSRYARGYPGVTKKFMAGYLKAWNWACANPRRAVTLARQHYTTTLSLDQGVALWNLTCSFRHTKNTKGQALGWMSLADWQGTMKILTSNPTEFGATQNVPPAKTLFTNRFVNTVYPVPCKKGQKSTKKAPCHKGVYR